MTYSTQVSTDFYGLDTELPESSLILEQEQLPVDSGEVKTMQEIAAEAGLTFVSAEDGGTAYTSDIEEIARLYYAQCGISASTLVGETIIPKTIVTINILKTPSDLVYKLVTNNGEFGDPTTLSIPKEESVNFRLTDNVDLGLVPDSIESIEWEGDIYNSSGGVVEPAPPVLSGSKLITNTPVYGVCRIKYTVFGDSYSLTVPIKDDKTYQATVYAFYGDNQVEELEVNFPNLSGECDQSVSIRYNDDEQAADTDPVDNGDGDGTSVALQLNAYDYCHGGAIGGATFWIGGKQVPATGHTVKRGMTYTITVKASGYRDFTNSFSV